MSRKGTCRLGLLLCLAALPFASLPALAGEGPRPYRGKVFLGLGTTTVKLPKDRRYKSTHGLRVIRVAAASSAEKAGLRVGDIIVSIDGKPWTSERIRLSHSFGKTGAKFRPGEGATFRVLRADPKRPDGPRRMTAVRVTLTPYPDTAPERPATPTNDELRPDLKNVHPAYETLCRKLVRACGYEAETRDLMARLARSEEYPDPHRLPIVRYTHRDAFKIEAVTREMVEPMLAPVRGAGDIPRFLERAESVLLRFDAKGRRAPSVTGPPTEKLPAFAGRDLKAHLDYVEAVLKAAAAHHKRAFARLKPDEIAFIRRHRTGLLDAFVHHHMLSYDRVPARQRASVRVLRLARRVDVAALLRQARLACLLVAPEFTTSLRKAAEASGKPLDKPVIALRKTPYGKVLVAGTSRTRYRGRRPERTDYAAIYDLGGDDVYANNCAASVFGAVPTAVLVDYDGDDAYESTDAFRQTYGGSGVAMTIARKAEPDTPPARFTQGAGDLGVGILVDLKGDDNYVGLRYSQGVGFMGVGVLCDEQGDDTYRGIEFHQGVAHWGAGMLIDCAGRDRYEGHHACQAVGFTGGFGLLLDVGPEGDSYYCKGKMPTGYGTAGVFEGWGQGLGVGYRPYASGGVGLLVDDGGPDRFEAGNFSQGGGYYYGFGVFYNAGKAPDVYIGSRYAQGFACHQASGAFIEEGGNDRYMTRNAVAQGLSWDETSALFIDEGGDDRYEGGGFSQGASAQNGFVIFIDRGGRDTYLYTDQARAGGNKYHGGKSLSFFLDLGGAKDAYPRKPNNAIVQGGANSIFADLPGTVADALKGDAWKRLIIKPARRRRPK